MSKKFLFIAFIIPASLFFTGCDPDDPDPIDPPELITTLNFTLTPDTGGTPVTMSFVDLDGDGGDSPMISEGVLDANTTYLGSIELLNELESPAENITEEVEEEDEDHQFFFSSTTSSVVIDYADEDADGNPLGLSNTLTTGEPASGSITIILRHEPDKFGTDVSDGVITNAGGETDIEVTFSVTVQ